MRTLVAALMAAIVLALAWAPHVHEGPQGDHGCAACLVRGAEAAPSELPDLAPRQAIRLAPAAAPITAEPDGAPLGAIPGQSPPVNA